MAGRNPARPRADGITEYRIHDLVEGLHTEESIKSLLHKERGLMTKMQKDEWKVTCPLCQDYATSRPLLKYYDEDMINERLEAHSQVCKNNEQVARAIAKAAAELRRPYAGCEKTCTPLIAHLRDSLREAYGSLLAAVKSSH